MIKICLQAGHENAGSGKSKGAPGEVEFNIDVRNRVASMLRERGFEVATADANSDKDSKITKPDWDLFLAIHYDADVYNDSGGFVDYPEPSTDGATQESQRIAKVISDNYFRVTGIKNKPNRSNANTRFYYMWSSLSKNTPCALIECGVGWRVPFDHNLFTYERERVFEGITRGICRAFNVPYKITPPEPEIPCDDRIKEAIEKVKTEEKENCQKLVQSAKDSFQDDLEKANILYEALLLTKVKNFGAGTLFRLGLKKLFSKTGK